MQYMTMTLEFIKARPAMHERLRRNRTLLPTVERLAKQLKASHEAWIARLSRTRPAGDSPQVASEALELALRQLGLSSAPPPTDGDPFPLEDAMAYLRRHTPPA